MEDFNTKLDFLLQTTKNALCSGYKYKPSRKTIIENVNFVYVVCTNCGDQQALNVQSQVEKVIADHLEEKVCK